MSNSIPIIKLAFTMDWKVLSQALQNDPNFPVKEFKNAPEAVTFLGFEKAALVLASLNKKEDLIQIATLMKIYKKAAPDTAVKVVVINFSGDKNYEKATAKLGIQDVIDPSLNTKAFRFKIDFWMKGLSAQSKKQDGGQGQKAKALEAQKVAEKKADAQGLKWEDPMDCEGDIWLLKNDSDCKRVLGKWLLRLMGPGPNVAQWNEVNGKNNLWRLEFKGDEKDLYCPGEGQWYFRGEQKPDFVWKENVWMITGIQFELFYQDTKGKVPRLFLKDKILTVCKNSEYAKTKEQTIVESFNKELVFTRDSGIKTTDEVDTEGGTDHLKNLEGKGKTEKQKHRPLSGKTDGTDDLTSGLLQMDLDPNANKMADDPMWGPASESPKQGTELGLENKNNEHKTHYKNHNAAEQYEAKDPLGYAPEKAREGAELSLDNTGHGHEAHHKGHGETERSGAPALEGKGSTDKLNKFYENGEKSSQTEQSELSRERELKRAKKEAIEAKEREAREKEEAQKKATKGAFSGEVSGNEGGHSGLAKAARPVKGQESNDLEIELPESYGKPSPASAKKKKDPEKEVLFRRPAEKKSSPGKDQEDGQVHSLAEARNLKTLENLEQALQELQEDPRLAEASESAQIISFLIQGNAKVSAHLDDHFDRTIIFSTKGEIDASAATALDLNFKYLAKDIHLYFTGVITEMESDEEGTKYVTLEMAEESIKSFDTFMKIYQLRQRNIDYFLKKARGL